MPIISKSYPHVMPIVFGQDMQYILTERDLQKIFGKKNFADKVLLFRDASNIASLISIIRIFNCSTTQITKILKGKNSATLSTVHVLSERGLQLKACGFSVANISSMLHSASKYAPIILSSIVESAPELIRLGYTPTNISSILNGTVSLRPKLIETILEHTHRLISLGYTPTNISSMIGGAAGYTHIIIPSVVRRTPQLMRLGYIPKNISSMLHGAGRFAPIVMQAIVERTPELIHLGYTTTNISSMLHASGSYVHKVVDAIVAHTPQLIDIGYSTTNISSVVGGSSRSAPKVVSVILRYSKDLLDLGISHNNISGHLLYQSYAKYDICLKGVLALSSQVLKLGYSQSDLRRLFYERVPSCQRAIDLMRSIIDTHDSFSTFSIYTPSHLVEMATSEGRDFDAKFFVTCLHAARATRTSGTVCSARQTRPMPDASHVDALSRPRSIEMGQDRARI